MKVFCSKTFQADWVLFNVFHGGLQLSLGLIMLRKLIMDLFFFLKRLYVNGLFELYFLNSDNGICSFFSDSVKLRWRIMLF